MEKYDDKKNFLFYADKKTEALKLNKKPVIEIFKILEKESNEILEKEFLKLKNRKNNKMKKKSIANLIVKHVSIIILSVISTLSLASVISDYTKDPFNSQNKRFTYEFNL